MTLTKKRLLAAVLAGTMAIFSFSAVGLAKGKGKSSIPAAKKAAKSQNQKKISAEKNGRHAAGTITAADFSYRGLKLGMDSDQMRKYLGEPHFDRDYSVYGIRVRYYVYGRKLKVGLAGTPERIVDITVKDEAYRGRNDTRYGSTPYHIYKTFGEKGRRPIDGVNYYIYENPDDHRQKLMLEADPANGSLVSWRFTSLPLTAEEADLRFDEFPDTGFLLRDVKAMLVWEKGIDTSAIDTASPVPPLTREGKPLRRKLPSETTPPEEYPPEENPS